MLPVVLASHHSLIWQLHPAASFSYPIGVAASNFSCSSASIVVVGTRQRACAGPSVSPRSIMMASAAAASASQSLHLSVLTEDAMGESVRPPLPLIAQAGMPATSRSLTDVIGFIQSWPAAT